MGTDGRWNGANSPIDPWQHGHEGGAERGDRKDHLPALDPRVGPLHRETAWLARGGTQGGLNCLTHALPRCLPTPTDRGGGWERVRRDRRVEGSPEAATQSER